MAMINPNSVVMSASDIPDDSCRASPVPNMVISLKVLIIPVTVPNKPSKGAGSGSYGYKRQKALQLGCVPNICS